MNRFPTTPWGIERYERTMYVADDPVRSAIRRDDPVVVVSA